MSNIDKRALREAAEKALTARARLALMQSVFDDDGDDVKPEAQEDISICVSFNDLTNPTTVLALLDELEAAEKRNAELEGLLESEVRLWTQRYDCANSRREVAEKRIAELEAREVVLPQRYSMLHRVDFDEPYHTEMVYKQHQVLEALHDAGVNVAAAGKGE